MSRFARQDVIISLIERSALGLAQPAAPALRRGNLGWQLVAPRVTDAVKARQAKPSARMLRDAEVLVEIRRVHEATNCLYGAEKVWWQLNREGITVARCTVVRLDAKGRPPGRRSRQTTPNDRR